MRTAYPLTLQEIFSIAGASAFVFAIMKEMGGLGVSPSLAAFTAVELFVCSTVMVAVFRSWRDRIDRLEKLEYQGGRETVPLIMQAKRSILVTHFTTLVPDDTYQALMRAKIKEGAHVTRILDADTACNKEAVAWLEEYRGHVNYSEYMLPAATIPLDFIVFDNFAVALYLPSTTDGKVFNQALICHDPEVVAMFKAIFERLKIRSKPTEHNTVKATNSTVVVAKPR